MERGGDLLNKKNAIDHNETLIFSIFMGCNTACECRFAHQTVAICVHKCTSLTLTRGSLAQIRKSPTKSGDPMAHHFISNGLWPHTSSSCFVIAQCSNESFKAVWRSNSPSSKEKKKKKKMVFLPIDSSWEDEGAFQRKHMQMKTKMLAF